MRRSGCPCSSGECPRYRLTLHRKNPQASAYVRCTRRFRTSSRRCARDTAHRRCTSRPCRSCCPSPPRTRCPDLARTALARSGRNLVRSWLANKLGRCQRSCFRSTRRRRTRRNGTRCCRCKPSRRSSCSGKRWSRSRLATGSRHPWCRGSRIPRRCTGIARTPPLAASHKRRSRRRWRRPSNRTPSTRRLGRPGSCRTCGKPRRRRTFHHSRKTSGFRSRSRRAGPCLK